MLSHATVGSFFLCHKVTCGFTRRQIRRAALGSFDSPRARIGKALDGTRHIQVSISYPVVVFQFAGVNLLPPPFQPRGTDCVLRVHNLHTIETTLCQLSASILVSVASQRFIMATNAPKLPIP